MIDRNKRQKFIIKTPIDLSFVGTFNRLNPLSLHRWFKEEETTHSVIFGPHIQQFDGSLVLSPVRASDAGKWVCVANNTLGEEKVIIKLVVVSTIEVHISPARLEVDVGKSATLNCSVRGGPVSLPVIWLKNGQPLISDSPFASIGLNIDDRIRLIDANVLYIRTVIREDSGMLWLLFSPNYIGCQSARQWRNCRPRRPSPLSSDSINQLFVFALNNNIIPVIISEKVMRIISLFASVSLIMTRF